MIKYKDQEKLLKLFVIPSIDKSLILGIDFWKVSVGARADFGIGDRRFR